MSKVAAQKKYTLGVDVGGTKIYTLLLDDENRIVSTTKVKTHLGTPSVILEKIRMSICDVLTQASLQFVDLLAIGVGFPGPLNPWEGIVIEATNLPKWDNFPLTAEISALAGCPAFLDNDVNLGTFAEALVGAGDGASNVVGIFLGTGVGGGLIFNKQIYHGTSGTAGEIGHMVVQYGGRKSPRKLTGSVEGLTSRTSVVERIEGAIKKGTKSSLSINLRQEKKIKSSSLAKAYRQNDKLVIRILHETATFVGVTVGSLVNLLAPDVIVLGGGLVEAIPEAILPIARKVAARISVPAAWKTVRLEEAKLGDNAVAMGAALLARQQIHSRPE